MIKKFINIYQSFGNKLYFLTFSVILIHFLFVLFYLSQKLLEQHSFRQTQTALSSLWMCKEGFLFNYQTPVVGYPWSIPFEFPLFQFLVAFFVRITTLNIDMSGRLISALFFWLSIIPIVLISLKLNLKKCFILVLHIQNPFEF